MASYTGTMRWGFGPPSVGAGLYCDMYLDLETLDLYGPKPRSGGWGAPTRVAGHSGNSVWSGYGPPTAPVGAHSLLRAGAAPSSAQDGDLYIDLVNAELYGPFAGAWPLSGKSLVGPRGATIHSGAEVPGFHEPEGVLPGDFFFVTSLRVLLGPYEEASGWPLPGVPLVGPPHGNTIWSGTGEPAAAAPSAQDGDFYLRTSTGMLYGPRAAGVWPEVGTPTGNRIWSGEGAPAAPYAGAKDGDLYVDMETALLYGPYDGDAGAWPDTPLSLRGAAGVDGAQGQRGAWIFTGSGDPHDAWLEDVQDGDLYLDTDMAVLWGPYAGEWPAFGLSLVGPAGGSALHHGEGAPADGEPQYSTGDFYVDTVAQVIYGPYSSGSWPAGVTLGSRFWSGEGAPVDGEPLGTKDGDFYLDTEAMALYGPYEAGMWPAEPLSLRGPKGPDGDQGARGAGLVFGLGAPHDDPQFIDKPADFPIEGDMYLDLEAMVFYGPYSESTGWPSGRSLVGPPEGNAMFSGFTDPEDGTPSGVKDGDTYINLTSMTLFGPYEAGHWPPGLRLGVRIWHGEGAPVDGEPADVKDGDWYIDVAAVVLYGRYEDGAWPSEGYPLRGIKGDAGADGLSLLSGEGAPYSVAGQKEGDMYIDTQNVALYGPFDGEEWPDAGVPLRGPPAANTLWHGAGNPTTGSPAGVRDGDFYLRTGAPRALFGPYNGGWGSELPLTGEKGDTGRNNTLLHGSGAPESIYADAIPGDFYLDTATYKMYGPYTLSGWAKVFDLVSPASGTGLEVGTSNPASAPPRVGDMYLNTTSYDLFGPYTGSSWGTPTSLAGPPAAAGMYAFLQTDADPGEIVQVSTMTLAAPHPSAITLSSSKFLLPTNCTYMISWTIHLISTGFNELGVNIQRPSMSAARYFTQKWSDTLAGCLLVKTSGAGSTSVWFVNASASQSLVVAADSVVTIVRVA